MNNRPVFIKRIIISMAVGLLLGAAINELTFLSLQETARPPKVIELVIPEGTAAQMAKGEISSNIPDNMTFVVGDTLVVTNNDVSDHELGPLWIPAGSSASMPLNSAESFAFSCSFQPSRYIGLDVREPLTLSTRINGILFSGLPLGLLLAVYSVVMPIKKT